jgi:hypothetical protein
MVLLEGSDPGMALSVGGDSHAVAIAAAVASGIPRGVDGHGRAKYYLLEPSRGARPERGLLRSYPLNLIRLMPAKGSQRDARPANAEARFFVRRRWAWN